MSSGRGQCYRPSSTSTSSHFKINDTVWSCEDNSLFSIGNSLHQKISVTRSCRGIQDRERYTRIMYCPFLCPTYQSLKQNKMIDLGFCRRHVLNYSWKIYILLKFELCFSAFISRAMRQTIIWVCVCRSVNEYAHTNTHTYLQYTGKRDMGKIFTYHFIKHKPTHILHCWMLPTIPYLWNCI